MALDIEVFWKRTTHKIMSHTDKKVAWGDIFCLTLPKEWLWSDDDGAVGVFRQDGVGALQISLVAVKDRKSSSHEAAIKLAKSFASQRGWDVPIKEIKTLEFAGSAVSEFEFTEHGDQPTYWHVWHIVGDERAAFITYSSDPKDSEAETVEIKKIVKSFSWLG